MQRLQRLTRAVLLAVAVFSIGTVLPKAFGPVSLVSQAQAAVARTASTEAETRADRIISGTGVMKGLNRVMTRDFAWA